MPATNVSWPIPLQRLTPWYPGQMGVPGTDSDRGMRTHGTGTVFYVDPNAIGVSDGRDGTDPMEPLATVGAALTHCAPYRGDVIAVMHNGGWTYGDPTEDNITPIQESVVVNVPGIRIVGIAPSGSLGVPWIPTDDNAVCITINVLDVLVEGFCFWNTGYTGTTGVLVQFGAAFYGDNATIRHCMFYHLAYGLQLDFTWNSFVEDCYFQGCTTVAIYNPSVYGEPDYLTVRDNVFTSNAADIDLPDTDNCLIEGNRFMDVTAAIAILVGDENTIHANTIQGDPTGANNYIDLTGGTNNLVSQNVLACTVVQYDTTCSDGGSGSWVGNYCTTGSPVAPPT